MANHQFIQPVFAAERRRAQLVQRLTEPAGFGQQLRRARRRPAAGRTLMLCERVPAVPQHAAGSDTLVNVAGHTDEVDQRFANLRDLGRHTRYAAKLDTRMLRAAERVVQTGKHVAGGNVRWILSHCHLEFGKRVEGSQPVVQVLATVEMHGCVKVVGRHVLDQCAFGSGQLDVEAADELQRDLFLDPKHVRRRAAYQLHSFQGALIRVEHVRDNGESAIRQLECATDDIGYFRGLRERFEPVLAGQRVALDTDLVDEPDHVAACHDLEPRAARQIGDQHVGKPGLEPIPTVARVAVREMDHRDRNTASRLAGGRLRCRHQQHGAHGQRRDQSLLSCTDSHFLISASHRATRVRTSAARSCFGNCLRNRSNSTFACACSPPS